MSLQQVSRQIELEEEDFDCLLDEISLSFWVDLTKEDMRDALTVGNLFDAVVLKMGTLESSRCLTSVAFYRLCRSLVEISGVDLPHFSASPLLQPLA